MSEQHQPDMTPGAFSWQELITQDPEGSAAFYSGLFGWSTADMEMPNGTYTMFMDGERPAAGMMKPPADKSDAPTTWINYITVEDLDASVAKALELGAKTCIPPTEIPGKGRFSGLSDPQGAPIALWEYAKGD
jgi:predicted enzyme related to lactoylglutathione lyase